MNKKYTGALFGLLISISFFSVQAQMPTFNGFLNSYGKTQGWSPEQVVKIDAALNDYSDNISSSLANFAAEPNVTGDLARAMLLDLGKIRKDYKAGMETILGKESMKTYLAKEDTVMKMMYVLVTGKHNVLSQYITMDLTKDQVAKLIPIVGIYNYAIVNAVLSYSDKTLSAPVLAAMTNNLDKIKVFGDGKVFEVLNAQQKEDLLANREKNKDMLKKVKAQEKNGYQADWNVIAEIVDGGRPLGRWQEGLLFKGILPTKGLKSAANWFPGTEDVLEDDIRIIVYGSASHLVRPGQLGTSILVELGNGKNFIFGFGPGAVINYLAAGHSINALNDIFLHNLSYDQFGALPYLDMFGGWGGRWDTGLRVYGPSGRTPDLGLKYMMTHLDSMLTWHKETFDLMPVGKGWQFQANEFDYNDDGGIAYEKDGVKITHWRQSYLADGSSSYKLEWKGYSIVIAGPGRPNSLTLKYAKGCDVFINDLQPELVSVDAKINGIFPIISRARMDMAHTPAYAAGYMYNQIQPRLALGTGMQYDRLTYAEVLAEIRQHYQGPFRYGAPDMVVTNVSREKIWVRDGVLPDYPNFAPPKFDFTQMDALVIPNPVHASRAEIQQQSIRDLEISPEIYYPKGYLPELIDHWPSLKPLYLPESIVPKSMKKKFPEKTSEKK